MLVKKLGKNEKRVVVIMTIVTIVVALVFVVLVYINDYYKATDKAKKAMLGNDKVTVQEDKIYYLFDNPKEEATKGIIFYPGGKVDETAYAPMLLELAESGYEVYLVKMPAKLAIFGMNRADNVIEIAPHIEEWTMMGHSLGGSMAASYSAANDEQIDILVLLASYSMDDLGEADIQVYSFYGSEDGVLNMENYATYFSNLPEDTIEEVIEGGNHAYYAHYGEQEGDGTARITREAQQEWVLDIFLNYQ